MYILSPPSINLQLFPWRHWNFTFILGLQRKKQTVSRESLKEGRHSFMKQLSDKFSTKFLIKGMSSLLRSGRKTSFLYKGYWEWFHLNNFTWITWGTGEGNGNPLQYSCLENPTDRGAWRATVHGVARVRHDLATKAPPPSPPGEPCFLLECCLIRWLILKMETCLHIC